MANKIIISEIIVADYRDYEFQYSLVRNKFGLCCFGVSLVLEVLAKIVVLCLDHHLLVVEVDLNILQSRVGKLDLISDLLAAVRRRV